jgi:hypothetical protein
MGVHHLIEIRFWSKHNTHHLTKKEVYPLIAAVIDRMPKSSRKHAPYSKIFDPRDHDEDPTSLKEKRTNRSII